ncbi:MAG: energy transducer TonB [Acidobacteriota bacterium]|nr:energy transducer TonB [Acidobacteriota bacterium]
MSLDFSFIRGRILSGVVAAAGVLLFSVPSAVCGRDAIQRLSEDDVKVVKKIAPIYPAIARQMNVTGQVVVDLTVNADGDVEKADVIKGSPILGASAVDAAKRWKFAPIKTETGVKPVVRVNFNFGR